MISKCCYILYEPEYFVDILRAGGRIFKKHIFEVPLQNATDTEIFYFIDNCFPGLSEGKDELWIKVQLVEENNANWLSIKDIISIHFFNKHRQESVSKGVLHTFKVYGIPVLETIENIHPHIFFEYDAQIRIHAARFIVSAWFDNLEISKKFIDQVKIGYKYQQSPNPEILGTLDSNLIWANLLAYNPGLRKFEERPDVLWLQDIQEVIKRTDSNLRDELKKIGEKHNSKFSDILNDVESSKRKGTRPSIWIEMNLDKPTSYFSELNMFLSNLGCQQNFFYSALLYLQWRECILNADYSGNLADNKQVIIFLNSKNNFIRTAIAEALFTLIYAGGPRVFQKAMIEAKFKLSKQNLPVSVDVEESINDTETTEEFKSKNKLKEFFNYILTLISKLDDPKKKEIKIQFKTKKITDKSLKNGEVSYPVYCFICDVFKINPFSESEYNSDKILENKMDFEKSLLEQFDVINKHNFELVDETNKNNLDKITKVKKAKKETKKDNNSSNGAVNTQSSLPFV